MPIPDTAPVPEPALAPAPGTASGAAPASTEPAAVAPGTVTAPVAPGGPAALPLALENAARVRLQPLAGVGLASDLGATSATGTPNTATFTVGGILSVTYGGLIVEGSYSDSFYQRRYLTKLAGPDGNLAAIDVSEQEMKADLIVGYELMHHMSPKVAERLTLTPFIGAGGRFLVNDTVPSMAVGPEVGGRVAFAASSSLVLGVGYAFLPNLVAYQGAPLVFGETKFDHDIDVDLSVRLFGAARVRIAYLSEYQVLTSAIRAYQTLAVGFDYGF